MTALWTRSGTAMPNNDQHCPACGATAISTGQFFGRAPVGFLPAGLRFWTFKARSVAFPSGAHARACTACGLVWVWVDAGALRQVLGEAGTDETRRRFNT
jgi:hypothetical protein